MSGMIKCKDPRVFAADAPSKTKSKHFTQMLNQAVSNYMNTSLQVRRKFDMHCFMLRCFDSCGDVLNYVELKCLSNIWRNRFFL